mgnify:CR=1 FL=1
MRQKTSPQPRRGDGPSFVLRPSEASFRWLCRAAAPANLHRASGANICLETLAGQFAFLCLPLPGGFLRSEWVDGKPQNSW